MNKPLTMMIKETQAKIAKVCNESGLPPVILDLIIQGVYSEIHLLTERQTAEEEKVYMAECKKVESEKNENKE